jgi:hypothetical protein
MKRFLFVCAAAIALVVGAQSNAEAVTSSQLHICQGAICVDFFGVNTAQTGMVPIVVGDYEVRAAGGTLEFPSFAQSATVALNVRRITFNNTNPLDVFFQALGYMTPAGPDFIVDTTLGATTSPSSPGSVVGFMAWLSTANDLRVGSRVLQHEWRPGHRLAGCASVLADVADPVQHPSR